ncbi:hypothetical protein QJQ45_017644 [Haematococcus lacustris]|nr:hypothetical protein QJQ45_017644 [Haematococcus lacustris]
MFQDTVKEVWDDEEAADGETGDPAPSSDKEQQQHLSGKRIAVAAEVFDAVAQLPPPTLGPGSCCLGARNPSHGVLNSCNVFASIAGAHKKHAMQQAMAAWGQLPKATKDLYKQAAKHINDVQGRVRKAKRMGLSSKTHPYRWKGAHAARCACCLKSTQAGSTGWVEIHVEGEAAAYRPRQCHVRAVARLQAPLGGAGTAPAAPCCCPARCSWEVVALAPAAKAAGGGRWGGAAVLVLRQGCPGQVTAQMADVIKACRNLKPALIPLAHRSCAEAAAAAHAVCQRLRGQEPASQLQPMPRLSSTPTQAPAQPGPAHAPCPHHLPDQPPSHPSQSQLQGSSQHHPALSAPLHLPGLSILTRPATNPVTSPAKEQQPIIHTTEEQDEQTMPPSMPKQQQDWATARAVQGRPSHATALGHGTEVHHAGVVELWGYSSLQGQA